MPTHPNLYTDHQYLPAVALNQMLAGHQVTQMIGVAAELGIADLLSEGPQTVEDLALQAQADAPSLRRVMRGLASVGVFARLSVAQVGGARLERGDVLPVSASLHGCRTGVTISHPSAPTSKAAFRGRCAVWPHLRMTHSCEAPGTRCCTR